jgi:hypothetical protein
VRRSRVVLVQVGALVVAALTACAPANTTLRLRAIPSTVQLRATSTPPLVAPAEQSVELPPLEGSTTTSTIAFPNGRVDIVGHVSGPSGEDVANAVVHLERLVGDQIAVIETKTDGAGNYRLAAMQAGRVRARAWRTPDLAQPTEVAAFVKQGVALDLQVQKFGGTFIQWSLAPGQPYLGRKANLVIQVAARQVGTDGVVRTEPVPDVGVSVVALGGLQPVDLASATTDAKGRASFSVVCNALGNADLTVTLATGEQSNVAPRPCLPPPTTTLPPPPTAPAVTVPVEAASTIAPAVPATNPVPTEVPLPPITVLPPVPVVPVVPPIQVAVPPAQQ